jgi:hypothetical protein
MFKACLLKKYESIVATPDPNTLCNNSSFLITENTSFLKIFLTICVKHVASSTNRD